MYILKTSIPGHELFFESYQEEEYGSDTVNLTENLNKAAIFDEDTTDWIPFSVISDNSYFVDDNRKHGDHVWNYVRKTLEDLKYNRPSEKNKAALKLLGWEFVKVERETRIVKEEK